MAALSPTHRCSISSTRTTGSTSSCFRSICSVPVALCRATSRTSRQKDIMYSSRTRYNTDVYRRVHRLKARLYEALKKVPEDRLSDEERKIRDELEKMPEITILRIIYQQKAHEGHAKDYEFSGTSMREHW